MSFSCFCFFLDELRRIRCNNIVVSLLFIKSISGDTVLHSKFQVIYEIHYRSKSQWSIVVNFNRFSLRENFVNKMHELKYSSWTNKQCLSPKHFILFTTKFCQVYWSSYIHTYIVSYKSFSLYTNSLTSTVFSIRKCTDVWLQCNEMVMDPYIIVIPWHLHKKLIPKQRRKYVYNI